MSEKILVVDDEHDIADLLEVYLRNENYTIYKYYSAKEALACIESKEIDLAILDIMLPDINGFSICQKIREKHTYPIIMLTAKDEETDKITGLTLGADDYVTKPFSLPVLYAKAMALTRRVHKSAVFLEAGSLKADVEGRRVWNRGELLALPPKEYEMLLFFMQNPGRIYSREQLLIRFWGYDFDGNERVVDNHIKKLRRAIGPCGCAIQTVRKSGYRLEVEG